MSTRSYPSYKDSGVEWLGHIPEHWGCVSVKRRTKRIQTGTTPPTSEQRFYEDGSIDWFGPSSFTDDLLLTQPVKRIAASAVEERVARLFQAGSTLVVTIGTVGKVGYIGNDASGNQQITALTFDSKQIVPKFAAYQLKRLEPVLRGIAPGTILPILNQSQIGSLPLAVPPSNEQQAIAEFLDRETVKIDVLVKKKERLIKLLREQRTALINNAVTQGFNPNAPKKDSGIPWLGDIPAHWEIKRLSTVCGFEQGKAHEPFVDDDGEFICVNSRFISTEGATVKFCRINLTPARRHDILMVMSDLPNGRALAKAYFVNDARKYAVNQRVCRLTAHKAHHRFLYYQLDRNEWFLQHDDGVNQTHLYNGLFTRFPALLPPLDEQKAIADFLDRETAKLDALMAKVRTVIERLQEYRTALISAAVTGQIDVRQLSSRPGTAIADNSPQ